MERYVGGYAMRVSLIVVALLLSFGVLSCKKETAGPPKERPKSAKTTPDKKLDKEAEDPGAKKPEPEALPEPEDEIDPNLTDPSKGELDPDKCKTKLEAEERMIRREFLPKLKAEQEAAGRVERWVESTYKVLEAGEGEIGKRELENFWKEYRECLDQLEKPVVERDPECVAYVTQDETACDRLTDPRTQQECKENVRIRPMDEFWRGWAKSGFSRAYCKNAPSMVMYEERVRCEALLEIESCDAEEYLSAVIKRHVAICEAAKAALQGKECGDEYPEGSLECQAIKLVHSKDRKATCLRMAEANESPLPKDGCDEVDGLESFDCTKIAAMTRNRGPVQRVPAAECEILLAVRKGKESCEGTFPPDSADCTRMISLNAFLSGDRSKCDVLPDERHRAMCRRWMMSNLEECEMGSTKEWGTGARDDTACRKLLWKKNLLPATEGRTELRLTLANVFDSPAECTFAVTVKGKTSTSSKSTLISFAGSELKVHSLFFLAEKDSAFDVAPTCTWKRDTDSEGKKEKAPPK